MSHFTLRPIQTNFTGGEQTPKLAGHVDAKRRTNGCRQIKNFTVDVTGIAKRRPGARHIAMALDNTYPSRLMDFLFDVDQTYVFEFGDRKLRILHGGGLIAAAASAPVNNPDFSGGASGWTVNGAVWSAGAMMMTASGHAISQAITTSDAGKEHILLLDMIDNGGLSEVSVTIGAGAGGTEYLDVSREDGYHSLAFTPTAATFHLRVAWKSGTPQLSRVGLASGALILGSPFGKDHIQDLQHDASEDITFIAHRDYKPRKLGRHGHASWSLTPYRPASDPFTGAGRYPRAVRFHKGRLWFGGARQKPRTLWASQSKAPFDMTTGAEDEKALVFTLLEQNPILWLASGRDLALGTLGNEQAITGDDGLITATNIDVSRHTSHGSSRVAPVQYNNQILFVDRSTRQLRAFAYDYANIDGYRGPDISLWGEHLLQAGVHGLALAAKPTPTLWLHDEDGRLRALTYEPEQDVLAWHDHPLGGDGRVESMTTTPFWRSDRLYLATRREFDGQTIRTLEYLEDGEWDGIEDAFYVDAGLSYAGDASAAFSGLTHLEGQTVSILADGIPHRPLVVQDGAVTLDHPAGACHIGLGYESVIETLPLEVQTQAGTAQGARKSWRGISVRLLESMGGTLDGQEILYRTPGDGMDQAIPPFTGDKEIDDLGWDDEGTVTIQQTDPLPMTVQAIFGKVKMA